MYDVLCLCALQRNDERSGYGNVKEGSLKRRLVGAVQAAKSTEKADPRQTRCIKLLRTVLTALKEPLQPASLCSGLLECLSEPAQSDCATRTALRAFSSCATMMFSAHGATEAQGVAPHEAAAQFAARAAEVAATESNAKRHEGCCR